MTRKNPPQRARRTKRAVARAPGSSLLQLAATWPFVTQKYMFGCDALLAAGRLFLIEMDDSVILRVGRERLKEALRVKGSQGWNPWNPGQPGDWVAFPPVRRAIPKALADFSRAAYDLSLTRKPPPRRKGRRKNAAPRRRP
jgi:hypothetical protein